MLGLGQYLKNNLGSTALMKNGEKQKKAKRNLDLLLEEYKNKKNWELR